MSLIGARFTISKILRHTIKNSQVKEAPANEASFQNLGIDSQLVQCITKQTCHSPKHNHLHRLKNDSNINHIRPIFVFTPEQTKNNSYFGELGNEADWMSFTNNLPSIHPSKATFIKAIHGGNADKFLV